MKKLIKVIGILAVVLIVLVGGLLVAAKILITPERVRQVVIPLAEEHLKRPVSIGDIDVRLFSGIVISDFKVGGRDDADDFVAAESMVLRYQFLPLLRLSVVVDEVRLNSPDIRIERYEDGEFNFSDLLPEEKPGDESHQASAESAEDATEDETGGLPIDVLVNEISIVGGRLVFIDHMEGERNELTDFSVSVDRFSMDRDFPVDLSAKINNAPFHFDGTINPVTQAVTADIRIQDLDASAFMAYAPDDFPGQLSGMTVSVDIRAAATEQALDSEGRITVTDINFLPDDMPDAHIENGRASLDYDVGLDLDSERITISKANADINGIALAASGHVLSYGSEPELDITVNLPMMALSDIIAAAPPKIVEPVVEMQPAGRIGARVHLKGAPAKPEMLVQQGEVTLERVGAAVNALTPEVTGDIRIENDSAVSDNMEIRLAEDLLRLDFSADNLMGNVKTIRHTLTADELDIDALLAAIGAEKADSGRDSEGGSSGEPGTSKGSQELGPLDLPLDVEGDVRVGSAVFHDLEIDSLDLQYRLKDNVFTADHIRGNLAGGAISGKARAELNRKPITYTADISVDGSRAEVILNALFPKAANTVFGTFFLKTDIKGAGTSWDTISQALTARGDVNVADGKLSGTGIAGGFANFLDSGKLDVITFDSLKGDVVLEDGNFNVDTEVDGQNVRVSPVGTIGLDGSLDLSLDLRLAPQIVSDIGGRNFASTYAQTDDGWTMVPVKLGGTLRSPKFRVDAAAVTRQLKERGKDELRKQLEERLFPKNDSGETGEETDKQEKRSIEKDLEDAVRGLFN